MFKIGDRLRFLIPGLHGPRPVVGRITAIAGNLLEVKTQNDGYHVISSEAVTRVSFT